MATSRSTNQYARHGNASASAGAYVMIPVAIETLGTVTITRKVDLPAGMKLRVTSVSVRAASVTSTPTVSVGSLATVTKYAAATNLATGLGDLTMASANQETGAGEVMAVQLVSASGKAATQVSVLICGFVTAHPTAAPGS